MSAQHLLLLITGLHVSTDHSAIFRSLICYKFQGAVHTFGIPIVFTLKPLIGVGTANNRTTCFDRSLSHLQVLNMLQVLESRAHILQHIKDLKMAEWSAETCCPIISINKCCADMKNWLSTNTHSQCVTLTAFPLQQWLHERASMLLYTYIVFVME